MVFLLLVLLLVDALILLVGRRNDGRGLNAVLLLAGRLVTPYTSLEHLVVSHHYNLLLPDTDIRILVSYPDT